MNCNYVTTETPRTNAKATLNVPSKMVLNRKRIRMSVEEKTSSWCSFLKHQFHSVMSSKFPTYFCCSIYVLICLLGNVVTGMIWLKHHQFGDDQHKNEIINLDKVTLLPFLWNKTTTIDGFGFEGFDEETKLVDILHVPEFLANESTDNYQVSLH